jgi:hypothetical protein
MMDGRERLIADLEAAGSCDCSYAVPELAFPGECFQAKRAALDRSR